MACPYFMPTHKSENAAWLHPSRLPLGAGWSGQCCAPGHEGTHAIRPSLRDHCNLGYATGCPQFPQARVADAVRFSIARDRGSQLESMVRLRTRAPSRRSRQAAIRRCTRAMAIDPPKSRHPENGGVLYANPICNGRAPFVGNLSPVEYDRMNPNRIRSLPAPSAIRNRR